MNRELHFVGATLLQIDSGGDTGDIIAHVRPSFAPDDTVHSVGCKTVQCGVEAIGECLKMLMAGKTLPYVPQWRTDEPKHYYKKKDVTEDALLKYRDNIASRMVQEYIAAGSPSIRLIKLPAGAA